MSPWSFSLEYWLSFLIKLKNDPSDNSNPSKRSSVEKTSLPIMLIFFIAALSPSSTSIEISIVFLAFKLSWISTLAPYLPFDEYERTSSDLTFSRVDLLYTSPSFTPTPSRLSINCSVFNALFPEISIPEIDGLSATVITSVFPSLPIWISSNCSVEKRDFTMSLDFLASILSPTLIGITLKILPVDTLCNPIILMSLTKNSSKADKLIVSIRAKNNFLKLDIIYYLNVPRNIIKNCKDHKHSNHDCPYSEYITFDFFRQRFSSYSLNSKQN